MFRYNMLAPGDRVVAAVSGGPDSVCLLSVLCELAGRLRATAGVTVAGVAHLNHKLRGEASEEDERFVAALAQRHGVPFYREEAGIAQRGGNLEQSARRERLKFFSRLIREGKANRIATGHTRDDQAETVLFRLLRGSGLAGLAGILPVTREGLIRPLLDVSRAEVEQFLRARGIAWREDGSNHDRRFARNRIRHDLLPQLAREWNPEIAGALARLADLAGEEERWWQAEIGVLADKLFSRVEGGVEIRAEALAGLSNGQPRAAVRRLVRQAISLVGERAEFDHVEKVIELAQSGRGSGCLELPGVVVQRSFDWMRFTATGGCLEPLKPPQPVRVDVPGRYRWPGGEVCFEVAEKPQRAGCVSLKWKGRKVPAHRELRGLELRGLELRGWRAGDHYRPWGRSRDQKIQEMFQKARIPSWKRGFWPIVSKGSKILWVREFGAAAEFASEAAPGPSLWIWEEKEGAA
jgi:tRNA(Ile)-lysidine synthase